jgi:hypothetical protein
VAGQQQVTAVTTITERALACRHSKATCRTVYGNVLSNWDLMWQENTNSRDSLRADSKRLSLLHQCGCVLAKTPLCSCYMPQLLI